MRHSRVGSSFLSLVLLALTSCGGSEGPGTTGPDLDPPRLTVINVLPDSVTLSFLGATSTLVPHLRDQNGQVFTATVSWSSDNTAVVTVSSSGLLTAVQNGTATVTATSGSVFDAVPVTVRQAATQLEVVSGGDQTGAVGQALGEAVVVLAKDAGGVVVAGATLTFVVSSGGGTVANSTVTTNAEGLASTTWTLGSVAGQQQLAVSVEGTATALLQVTATGSGAAPVSLTKSSGDQQSGALGQPVPEVIVVQLQDEFENGVAGEIVTFVVTSGGGTVSTSAATTGATGLASTIWTMGSTAGAATLTATATGLTPVVFTATAVVPSPDLVAGAISVSPGSPTSQQTFTVTVPVTNSGTSTPGSSFSVQLLVDGVEAVTQTVAAMAPDATTNVAFTVGPLAAGTRLLSSVVDSDGVVTESDESNNTAQQAVIILAQATLQAGTPITGLSASKDVELLFAFEHIGDNSSIQFALDGATDEDADIYVALNSTPQAPLGLEYVGEPSLGTCKGITPDANETCLINQAKTGTYHILIHAFTTFSDVTLTVTTGLPVQTFNIELNFLNAGSSGLNDAFEAAALQWEKILPLDISDVPFELEPQPAGACGVESLPAIDDLVDDLRIYVDLDSIDGPGGILGRAGFCFFRTSNKLPIIGFMEFDTADLSALEANLRLEAVILHEMGHVLGIGTLWSASELLRNPSFPSSPGVDTHFAGPLAIDAFNAAGGTAYSGAKVPVENTAKAGQADGHWRESVLGNELMTPLLEFGPKLSAISIQSLADVGYPVDASQGVPYVVPGLAAAALRGPILDLSGDIWTGPILDLSGDIWTGPIVGVNAGVKRKFGGR